MITVETIEKYYNYFYSKKYQLHKYKLKSSKTTKSVCNSFLALVDKEYSLHSAGDSFLWDYFIFQFQYWHDLTFENNRFTDKIVIAWIIGKKAFDRWKERNREYDWQIESSSIIELYSVQKKDLFMKHAHPEKVNRYDSSKPIRKMYHNTEEGFAMCIEYTTLFDPEDESCIQCQFKEDCKELLRVNYPKLYRQRLQK